MENKNSLIRLVEIEKDMKLMKRKYLLTKNKNLKKVYYKIYYLLLIERHRLNSNLIKE